MLGASFANVMQATPGGQARPAAAMLAWAMAIGAADRRRLRLSASPARRSSIRGPGYWPGCSISRFAASALAFSLYFPVVRTIGPAKAAYSSVLVPIIAMAFSTLFEGYLWSPLAALGAVLAIGGMVLAIERPA